jgi:ribosomal protein L11 methyltransferase
MAGANGRATVIASFDRADVARKTLRRLPAGWRARVGEVVGDAWRDEWKKYFEPFSLCASVVVRPPWRSHRRRRGERVLVLEPGRAFGTGLHETTRLVARLLSARSRSVTKSTVLDVGCGSGILGLLALQLGAERVRAIDIDPDAVLVTRENARRNGVSARILADCTPLASMTELFNVVLANIDAATLVKLAPALAARVASGGRLFLSGILAPELDASPWSAIQQAYAALEIETVKREGQWLAAVLRA